MKPAELSLYHCIFKTISWGSPVCMQMKGRPREEWRGDHTVRQKESMLISYQCNCTPIIYGRAGISSASVPLITGDRVVISSNSSSVSIHCFM